MKEYVMTENDSGQRLDRFLQKILPDVPKSLRYKWIRTGHIRRNRKRVKPDDRLVAGDRVQLFLPEEYLPKEEVPPAPFRAFEMADADPDILYEDDNILLVEKPVGLVVHCDNRQIPDTLINRVLRYLHATGAYTPETEHSFTPALCNRLDRNTGGIVIAAKTAASLREVNRMIRENQIHKTYLCVTVGTPSPRQAEVHAWHRKSSTHNMVEIRDTEAEGFREIITEYRVLAENSRHALVEVNLITGRTHQIRAHFAHLGTPILGDTKYGDRTENRRVHANRQALWAYQIEFDPVEAVCLRGVSGKTFHTTLPDFVRREFPDILS